MSTPKVVRVRPIHYGTSPRGRTRHPVCGDTRRPVEGTTSRMLGDVTCKRCVRAMIAAAVDKVSRG